MTDAIKIGVKVGLVAIITAGIIALFANIQVPSIDYTSFTNALNSGLAVCYHYVPVAAIIFPVVLAILAFDVALRAFQLAMIAVRWIMKVNE